MRHKLKTALDMSENMFYIVHVSHIVAYTITTPLSSTLENATSEKREREPECTREQRQTNLVTVASQEVSQSLTQGSSTDIKEIHHFWVLQLI